MVNKWIILVYTGYAVDPSIEVNYEEKIVGDSTEAEDKKGIKRNKDQNHLKIILNPLDPAHHRHMLK